MTDETVAFGRLSVRDRAIDAALGFAVIAALVLVPVLRTPAALAFLLFGVLVVAHRPVPATAALLRHWYLLALPVFSAASALWSRLPEESLRGGLQLGASFLIAIVVATRMPLRTFLRTLFACLGALVLLSLVAGETRADTQALLGLYGSKNAMAGAAALFGVIAFGLAISGSGDRAFRALAATGALAAPAAVLLAQSVSGLAVLPLGIAAFMAAVGLYRMGPGTRIVVLSFLVLLFVPAAVLATAEWDRLAFAVLEATGKDLTLTGRTDLWRAALVQIAERPLLGIGFGAFWTEGHAPAEALWAMFGIDSRSGFNFHNTYLSNAVEIGLLGAAMQLALMLAAMLLPLLVVIATGERLFALLFAASVMLFATTMIEVPVFLQFSPRTFLVVATLVYAVEARRALRC